MTTASADKRISVEEVSALLELGISFKEIVAEGYTIGSANVESATAAPTAPAKPKKAEKALLDAAELLFNAGRKVRQTAEGRERHVIGDQEGMHPFRVIVTKGK